MLKREGWRDNHKRIYRLYSELGLSLRLKRPRRNKSALKRQPQPQGLYPNHLWGMNFVYDARFDGGRLRLLTVIDLYTREYLGICVGQNLRSSEVAGMLNIIALRRPLPQLLKQIMALNLREKCWISGCTNVISGLTSHGQVRPRIMPRWNHSTAGCVRSA